MCARAGSAGMAGLAVAALVVMTACGSSGAAARPTTAELTVTRDPGGGGRPETWSVTCPSAAHTAACARLLAAPEAFTTPAPNSACSLIYGGPEVLTVTGHVGTRDIQYRTGRTNGCEIADYTRDLALTEPFRAAPPASTGHPA